MSARGDRLVEAIILGPNHDELASSFPRRLVPFKHTLKHIGQRNPESEHEIGYGVFKLRADRKRY